MDEMKRTGAFEFEMQTCLFDYRVAIHIASMHGMASLSLGASQCQCQCLSLPAPLFACLPIFLDCVKDAAGAGAGAGRPLQICVFLKFIEFRTQKETENQRENSTQKERKEKKEKRRMNAKNERKTEPMNSKRASCIHAVACHTPHATRQRTRPASEGYTNPINKAKKRVGTEMDAYIERLDSTPNRIYQSQLPLKIVGSF